MKAKTISIRKITINEEKPNYRCPSKQKSRNSLTSTSNITRKTIGNLQGRIPTQPVFKKKNQFEQGDRKKSILTQFDPNITKQNKPFLEMSESVQFIKKTFKDESSDEKQPIQSSSESEEPFIDCINGYIHQLRKGTSLQLRDNSKNTQEKYLKEVREHSKSNQRKKTVDEPRLYTKRMNERERRSVQHSDEVKGLQTKLLREREINRKLQKSVIEIQKVLWHRTQAIEKLQRKVCRLSREDKENRPHSHNRTKTNKIRAKEMGMLINPFADIYSSNQSGHMDQSEREEFDSNTVYTDGSDFESSSRLTQIISRKNSFKNRRKTEIPSELEKMIERTLGLDQDRGYQMKNFKRDRTRQLKDMGGFF